jgi:AbrB family looped-hinge helix DNA binding protein
MSKVTSKLQVTIPKAIADKYRIRPGDEVRWEVREPGPMMVPEAAARPRLTPEERVALFDEETRLLREIQGKRKWPLLEKRDWTREDLYEPPRGLSR